jgi:hypothetical protein
MTTPKLDKLQRAALKHHYLCDADGAIRRRCHAILLLADGRTVAQAAALTCQTAAEVDDAVRRFRAGGVEAMIQSS